MAEIDNRRDLAPLQVREGEVGKFPVELGGSEIDLVDWWAIAKEVDSDFLDTVEILAPTLVMAAGRHLVDARLTVIDRRDAVLDPGREHEVGDGSVPWVSASLGLVPGGPVARRPR